MFSLSVAPYTSDKKGILDGMTKCPSGLDMFVEGLKRILHFFS